MKERNKPAESANDARSPSRTHNIRAWLRSVFEAQVTVDQTPTKSLDERLRPFMAHPLPKREQQQTPSETPLAPIIELFPRPEEPTDPQAS